MFMLCYEECKQKCILCSSIVGTVICFLDKDNVLLCNYAGMQVMILQKD